MKQSLHIGKEPNLHKIVITSAVLHLLFITLITIPLKSKDREYRSYYVNLVGPSEVRRTVKTPRIKKTVPQKTISKKDVKKEEGAVKMKAPPRKRVAPQKGVSLEPEKSAEIVTREIERLRAIKDLSKLKKKREKEMAQSKKADEEIARAIEGIKRKKIISISSGAGIPSTQSSKDSDSYYALVTQNIWSEWIYPEFDASGLEVIISIKIGKDGKVISQEIEKSSGNTLFDRSAAKAISKASPLPSPPVEMEIGVRFHL